MRIKYDKTTDTLYVEFADTTVTTKRLSDDIAVDYDASGKLAGIEVLGARQLVGHKWDNRSIDYHEDALVRER